MESYVAYYRVSTGRQGRSGLGLEAQRERVQEALPRLGGELIAEFTEVMSGRRKRRPQLEAALRECKRRGARLIVAKLDRMARNLAVFCSILDSAVDFHICDMPEANRLTLQIMGAIAEWESAQIGRRVKEAIAVKQARGEAWGTHGKVQAACNVAEADAFAWRMAPIMADLEAKGFRTFMEKTHELNRRGIPTACNGSPIATGRERWHIGTVHRLVKRIERLQAEAGRLAAAA